MPGTRIATAVATPTSPSPPHSARADRFVPDRVSWAAPMPAAPSVDARRYLDAARARVDRWLDEILPAAGTGAGRLHEAMRYSVFAGGKRLRPALAMAAAESVGGSAESALAFAG